MKRFLLRFVLFAVIIAALFAILLFAEQHNKTVVSDYMAAMIDKHNLADSIKTPKLILAGGSNVAFGLNSSELQDSLQMPVVNMGLHAGLGLNFIINELATTAKSGDVILLSIEYLMGNEGEDELEENAASYYRPAANYFHPTLIERTNSFLNSNRKAFRNLLQSSCLETQPDTSVQVYSRAAFNKHGDEIAHLNKQSYPELNDKVNMEYTYWSGIKTLNAFYSEMKSRGVKVYFFFPAYPLSEYLKNHVVIDRLYHDMKNDLAIKIIGKPEDFVFPDNDFFDTIYHLNKTGREKRTATLISLIKKSKLMETGFN